MSSPKRDGLDLKVNKKQQTRCGTLQPARATKRMDFSFFSRARKANKGKIESHILQTQESIRETVEYDPTVNINNSA